VESLQNIQLPEPLNKTFNVNLPRGLVVEASFLQAGAIVFLIFLLILTLGQLRRRFVDWHFQGFLGGIIFGFAIALILEGFLLIGGKTVITGVLGWKNAPEPITKSLDAGRTKLVDVLGVKDGDVESSSEKGKTITIGGIMEDYNNLSGSEAESLKSILCTP